MRVQVSVMLGLELILCGCNLNGKKSPSSLTIVSFMMWVIFGGSGNNQTKHLLFNKQWKKILGDPLHIIVFLSWIGCSKYILKVRQCFKRKKDEAVLKLLNFYVHKKFFIGLFFLLGAILRQLPNIGAGTWMLQLRTLVSTLKPLQRWALNKKYLYFIWTGSNIVKEQSIFPVISKCGIYSIKRCFHTLSKLLMCKSGLPGC